MIVHLCVITKLLILLVTRVVYYCTQNSIVQMISRGCTTECFALEV